MSETVLQVEDLRTHFFTRSGVVKAVDGVNFSVGERETLGIVGESGSGKSMTALSILRLVPAPAGKIVGGRVLLRGDDLLQKSEREMQRIRGRRISMILQDPMTSLDPLFTIGDQLAEPIRIHQQNRTTSVQARVEEMLRLVRIASPEQRTNDYPHQMSGGMRQRIVGAIALACRPELLIADEPTTSLDVIVEAKFLDLLKELQKEFGLTILLITHNIGVVAEISDRIAVMYAAKMVEVGDVNEVFATPKHPYTQGLLKSVPNIKLDGGELYKMAGAPPDLSHPPAGCRFHPRCPFVMDICRREVPPLDFVEAGHQAACWLYPIGEKKQESFHA